MKMHSSTFVVACKEFRDMARSFWLFAGSALFVLTSLAVIYGISALGGDFSFRPLPAVMNSLVMLDVFLIPLIAILISYDAFVGEKEQGTLLLLLTYPVSRSSLLVGKLLGQGFAFGLCLLIGSSVLPVLTFVHLLPYDLAEVVRLSLMLIFSGWLFGLVFILISYACSLCASTKSQALAALLLIWLISVLLYDLGLLIFTITFEGKVTNEFLNICLMINPSSLFRMLNQQLMESAQLGFNGMRLGTYLIIWCVVFFFIDHRLLTKRSF